MASPIGDISGLEPGDTRTITLSGVFDDADGDPLAVTARSSAASVATLSVVSNYTSLTVRATGQGTATITVTADDGNGGTVSDTFTVTVEAANQPPTVATALGDISGLEPGDTRTITLSGVFDDADGDPLAVTARSSAASVATLSVVSNYTSLTVRATGQGTATITVTASDGRYTASDTFTVTVEAASTELESQNPEDENQEAEAEAEAEETDPLVRYDANGDGKTQYSEYETALADYLGGSLTIGELMAVRAAWVRDAR